MPGHLPREAEVVREIVRQVIISLIVSAIVFLIGFAWSGIYSDIYRVVATKALDVIFSHINLVSVSLEGMDRAEAVCPNGALIVGGGCVAIDDNGNKQATVGPIIKNNTLTCYRFGSSQMKIRATAICLKKEEF
jgi:hypothetical protein